MRIPSRIWMGIVVVLAGIAAAPAFAGPTGNEGTDLLLGLSSLEKELFEDARDGRLQQFTLMEAALVASGVPDRGELTRWNQRFVALETRAREEITSAQSDREVARSLFNFVHRVVLKSYDRYRVDLLAVLSGGEYNCVSATILYNALLEDLDIPSSAILVPSHVFTLLPFEEGDIEVETTSPSGFDPVRSEEEYRRLLKRYDLDGAVEGPNEAGDRHLFNESRSARQVIDNITLVSLIYTNLAAARLRDGDQTSAFLYVSRAVKLSGGGNRLGSSLDALVNNLIVERVRARNYPSALGIVGQVKGLEGLSADMHGKLKDWGPRIVVIWSADVLSSKDYERAVGLLLGGIKEYGEHPLLLDHLKAAYVNWGIQELEGGDLRKACSIFLAALERYPGDGVVRQDYLAATQRYAERLAEEGDLDRSLAAAEFALAEAGKLVAATDGWLSDLSFEVGMAHFRRKDYEKAAKAFLPGVGRDPRFLKNYAAASINGAIQKKRARDYDGAVDLLSQAIRAVHPHVSVELQEALDKARMDKARQ